MGIFYYPMEIASTADGEFHKLRALVDTGSTYTWIPGRIMAGLGYKPMGTTPLQMADGSVIQREFTEARVRIEGQVRTTVVVFGEPRDEVILGAVTLESCGMCADSVNHRIIPMPAVKAVSANPPNR